MKLVYVFFYNIIRVFFRIQFQGGQINISGNYRGTSILIKSEQIHLLNFFLGGKADFRGEGGGGGMPP